MNSRFQPLSQRDMTPTPLTEKERDIADFLRMMMASSSSHGPECEMHLCAEYAAVWDKMQKGST